MGCRTSLVEFSLSKPVLMWIFLRGAELVGGLAGEWGDWLKGRLPAGSRMTWAPF